MKYDREYFQTFCPAGYVVLRIKPVDESKISILARALNAERVVAGTIDDLAQDALWLITDNTYAMQRVLAAAPLGAFMIGASSARERVPYESILSVERRTPAPN